jgi:membrane fusion protein (multidrug efflux system)
MTSTNPKMWIQSHRRLLLVGGPILLLVGILIIYLFSGRYISTDNAYIRAAQATISSNVSGQVLKINIKDNQVVHRGDTLFRIDDRLFKLAVENAMAKLVSARLQVDSLKAIYQQQMANVAAAQSTFIFEQEEYERQKKLASSGISSQMQLNKAANTFNTVKQHLVAAKQELVRDLVNLGNNADIAVDQHPLVQQAQAVLDKVKLDLFYTAITAPMDGIVTKVEQLQVGDYINVGAPVFALISNKDIWVEANFKENQINYMRPGQHVTIEIDAYPDLNLQGHVVTLSPGTGSVFSLLPAENATGNWVKISQRLPVRIELDKVQDWDLLHSGLSVTVDVDTKHSRFSSAGAR